MKKIPLCLLIIICSSCFGGKSLTNEEIQEAAKSHQAIFSLLVEQNNQPIIQDFYHGKNESSLVNVQSVTKSLMALLIGIAIDEGSIKSADETIDTFFPEIQSKINIQHLMDQTSGFEWAGFTELEKWSNSTNPTADILQRKLTSTPGEVYNYNSAATHLLSPILEKATAMSTLDFAKEKLFTPLGIDTVDWKKLNDGFYDASGLNLSMRSKDLQKIGRLILNEGNFQGKTIISKNWINQLFAKENKKKAHWGLRGSTYGHCWYTTKFFGEEVLYAMGYGGQYIFIFPDLNATVVANHEHDTPDGIEQATFFIENILIPLVKNLKENI